MTPRRLFLWLQCSLILLLSTKSATSAQVQLNFPDSLQHEVLVSIENGNTDQLILLLDNPILIPLVQWQWNYMLFRAGLVGDARMIRTLLDRGASIDAWIWEGRTALWMAASYNLHDDAFQELLNRGANPSLQDTNGISPLHISAQYGRLERIKALISLGIDPNIRDHALRTPLHFVAQSRNLNALLYLLDEGADLTARDSSELTPLIYAWRTPAHYPMSYEGPDYYDEETYRTWGAPEMFKALLDHGANFSDVNWKYSASVLRLVEYDNAALLAEAVNLGAKLTVTSGKSSLLHTCAKFDCAENASFIISKGAAPDPKDTIGETPLIVACRRGSAKVVKILLEASADPNYCPPTPPKSVQDSLHMEVFICGHRSIAFYPPLCWSVAAQFHEITRLLLEHGANPNVGKVRGEPIIFWPIELQDTATVKLMLECDADPNVRGTNGVTPLETALNNGNLAIADLLFEHGASITLFSDPFTYEREGVYGGFPLLHQMARKGDVKAMEWLLAHGASITEVDRTGLTPVCHALYSPSDATWHTLSLYRHSVSLSEFYSRKFFNLCAEAGLEDKILIALDDGLNPAESFDNVLASVCLYHPKLVSQQDSTGAIAKRLHLAERFLQAGVDPKAACNKGSIVEYALRHEAPEIAELCLNLGADPTAVDSAGATILHRLGNSGGRGWQVDLLCKYGANPKAVAFDGYMPVHCAVQNAGKHDYDTDWSFIAALVRAGVDLNESSGSAPLPLRFAYYNMSTSLADYLISLGADTSRMLGKQVNPLTIYVVHGDIPNIKLYLDQGQNPSEHFMTPPYNTPLHVSAGLAAYKVVKLLLEYHADPNAINQRGDTPLHLAAGHQMHPDEVDATIEYLLAADADPLIRNRDNQTPLDIARNRDNRRAAALLDNAMRKK